MQQPNPADDPAAMTKLLANGIDLVTFVGLVLQRAVRHRDQPDICVTMVNEWGLAGHALAREFGYAAADRVKVEPIVRQLLEALAEMPEAPKHDEAWFHYAADLAREHFGGGKVIAMFGSPSEGESR